MTDLSVLERLTEGKFVIAGTGARSLDLVSNTLKREYLNTKLVETLYEAKKKWDLLVLSGGAEGWDRLLAFACMEAGVDFALVIPTKGYGQYYYTPIDLSANPPKTRGSVNNDDRFHLYREMLERAVHVEYYPNKIMRYGVQNLIRNQRLVDLADIMWVWDPTSRGTKDCMDRIRKAHRRFYEFKYIEQYKLF